MASALGRLIEDVEELKVEQRFTVEHMTNAYEAVYSELLR